MGFYKCISPKIISSFFCSEKWGKLECSLQFCQTVSMFVHHMVIENMVIRIVDIVDMEDMVVTGHGSHGGRGGNGILCYIYQGTIS